MAVPRSLTTSDGESLEAELAPALGAERADARAALRTLVEEVGSELPLILAGWSFGGDVALSVSDPTIDAWLAIAPPLRFATDLASVAADRRPKHLALAEHDEFRSPHEVADAVAGWQATTVDVVGGASHFFFGRTDRLVVIASAFADEVAAART